MMIYVHLFRIFLIIDFCILDGPVDVKSIQVYPFYDPSRLWMTDSLKDLKVEIFAAAMHTGDVKDDANEDGADKYFQ